MISEVQITPVKPCNGLVAFASLVLNNGFYISSIGVHVKRDGSGFRLTYPTKKIGDRDLNIFHPINPEVSKLIETAIFKKCNEFLWQTNV